MITHPVMFFRNENEPGPVLTTKFIEKVLKPPNRIIEYENTGVCVNRNDFRSDKADELSEIILNIIVERRIFRNKELNDLFSRIRKYCRLTPRTIEKAIQSVKNKLDE